MRPPRGVRRDLRWSLVDGGGYGLMAGIGEAYFPAFALAIGMPPALAGLVATAPLFAGGVLQLAAPRVLVRVRSLQRWIATCMVVQGLAFVPLVAVALLGGARSAAVFAAASVYWAAGMAASAGWNPWMARVVPERIRSRFFARRQGFAQAAMLVGLIGAGLALHQLAAHEREAYAVMFGVAGLARLVSALAITRQGAGIESIPRRRARLRSIPPKLWGTQRGSLLGYLVVALAAAAVSGAFLTPYLLHQLDIGYARYSVFTATIVVTKVVAMPLLGRAIQKVGVRRVVTICALAIVPIPLLWAAGEAFPWLLAIQLYSGIAWGGFELGMLIALFEAEDDAERTTMQVAFSALQAIGTAGASFAGATILAAFGSGHEAYLWVFGVSAIARFGAALLLVRRLREVVLLPVTVVARAWTLAVRPWGGTIVRPIVEGWKLVRGRREDADDVVDDRR